MTDTTQNATLVAGTCCFYRILGESQNFKELEGVRSLGRIGETGSYVDQSTLKDRTKRYIGGVKDTEESTMKLARYFGDDIQQEFIDGVEQSKSMEFKVVYPAAENGKQLVALFQIATSGYGVPETSDANTIIEYDVSYRISGKPSFASASGSNTASVSAVTITTAGEFSAPDGEYTLTQGKEFATSGTGINAALNATVADGAITAVTVAGGGIGHQIDDVYTVINIGGGTTTTQATLTVSEVS